jgi:hypothetical protein
MATSISWLLGTVLMFLGFGLLASSALGSRRRSRFRIRLSCTSLVALVLALGVALAIASSALPQRALGAAWVALLLAALTLGPVFCYHTFAPSQGSSDGDGGPGSHPLPPPPTPPGGDVPLRDADQARTRRRDHNRPNLRGVSPRRPAVEPARRRSPTGRRH